MQDLNLTDEAIESISDLAEASSTANRKLAVVAVNDHQVALVSHDGTYDIVASKFYDESVKMTSFGEVFGYVKTVPWEHIVVALGPDQIAIAGEVNAELELGRLNSAVKFVPDITVQLIANPTPTFLSAPEMARLLKTSPLWVEMEDVRTVIAKLDRINWHTTLSSESSGRTADKSNYGSMVQSDATVESESPALEDIRIKCRVFSDHAIPVTRVVKCFFEFDHEVKKVAIVPYGGEIDRLLADTFDWMEENLHESFEGLGVTVLREAGTGTGA